MRKLVIRTTSPSVNFQTIIDGVRGVIAEAFPDRMAQVNAAQAPAANTGSKSKKATPRQGSSAPSNASTGSSASRASFTGRTVRFEDQEDTRPTAHLICS